MNNSRFWRLQRIARQRMLGRYQRRTRGQALVELALAVTFLAYLFAAAVDLGLAYKAYQTLITATAEANNYLTILPLYPCDTTAQPSCTTDMADSEARIRFRGEQGDQLRGTANTLDLDANGKDDLGSGANGDGRTEDWLKPWVQIDEADSSQVTINNSNFAVDANFDPTKTDAGCQQRKNFSNGQCFIVIRTQIYYRPFAISPAVGNIMTIRAISVQPIVNGQP